MKYKNYGNNNKEYDNGLGVELIEKYDEISDRSINRPITNLNENQEEIYNLLNSVIKTVYGKTDSAIIPGIYEDFDPEGFIINSFKSDSKNFFLRIPTGAMILKSNNTKDNSADFFAPKDKRYNDLLLESNFTKDIYNSYSFVNRPNINLFERQLANMIGLNLDDLENDIKVTSVELPINYPVYMLTESGNPYTDESGNFEVAKIDGKTIYECELENAEYYSDSVETQERTITRSEAVFGEGSKTYTIPRYFIKVKNPGTIPEGIFKKYTGSETGSHYFTTIEENAKVAKDENGNIKKRIGYCVKVDIADQISMKSVNLPNKKENATWLMHLPKQEEAASTEYKFSLMDGPTELSSFSFNIKVAATADEVNNILMRYINSTSGLYLKAEKVSKEKNMETLNVLKIVSRSSNSDCDKYTITITKGGAPATDTFNDRPITGVLPKAATKQKYYYNIFEVVNNFCQIFKENMTTAKNLYNYLSCESILNINGDEDTTYKIYYDLNFDTANNKDNPNYDKSGRFFITKEEQDQSNLIKLFEVKVTAKGVEAFSKPKIESISYFVKTLDKRIVSTKRAELGSLKVSERADITGQFTVKNTGGDGQTRGIDLKSTNEEQQYKDPTGSLPQTRIYSPLLRLTTTDNTALSKPLEAEGADAPESFADSFKEVNLSNGVASDPKYHSNDDAGIIINKDHGVRVYNNSSKGKLELVSREKDINIISNSGKDDSKEGVIGIKDYKDDVSKKDTSIDILGRTTVRSKNDNQVVVRRTGGANNPSTIQFQNEKNVIGEVNFAKDTSSVNHADIHLADKDYKVIDITNTATTIQSNVTIDNSTNNSAGTGLTITKNSKETEALSIKGTSKFDGNVTIGENGSISNLTITGNLTGTGITSLTAGSSSLTIRNEVITESSPEVSITGTTKVLLTNGDGLSLELTGTDKKAKLSANEFNIVSSTNINTDNEDKQTTIKGNLTKIDSKNGLEVTNTVKAKNGEVDLGTTNVARIHTDTSGNIIFSWD